MIRFVGLITMRRLAIGIAMFILHCVPIGRVSQVTLHAQEPELIRFEYTERLMGTALKLVVYAKDRDHASLAIDTTLSELKARAVPINNYDPESEVSRLASLKPNESHELGSDLGRLLLAAFEWNRETDGAFDVTSGSLFDVWSKARKESKLPDAQLIKEAKARSGWGNVVLKSEPGKGHSILIRKAGLKINVSGIATGFLLDEMMEGLKREGIRSALIDLGGDIIVSEAPPGKLGWSIDVAGLEGSEKPVARLVLNHCGVTTSGDLSQFVEIDGVRYSHLIDPSSGQPVPWRVSATVVAKRAIDADAGATALAVMGWEKAKNRLPQLPLDEVHLLTIDGMSKTVTHQKWTRPDR